MTLIKTYFYLTVGVFTLTACSTFDFKPTQRLCADENGNFYSCVDLQLQNQDKQSPVNVYDTKIHFVSISEYTQQLAMQLKMDLPKSGLEGAIVVTPFTYQNETIDEVNRLKQNLTDYLVNDLRNLGVVTTDQSVNKQLVRTDDGEIEFSLKQLQMLQSFDASYVLTGKILRSANGVILNSSILELKSGKLIASGMKMVPNIIVNDFI